MFLTVVMLSSLAAVYANAQDAAAHKAWMDDAGDLQGELREQLLAKSGDNAASAAITLEGILAKTQAYWAQQHADDIVSIARNRGRWRHRSPTPPAPASSIRLLKRLRRRARAATRATTCIPKSGECYALGLKKA